MDTTTHAKKENGHDLLHHQYRTETLAITVKNMTISAVVTLYQPTTHTSWNFK